MIDPTTEAATAGTVAETADTTRETRTAAIEAVKREAAMIIVITEADPKEGEEDVHELETEKEKAKETEIERAIKRWREDLNQALFQKRPAKTQQPNLYLEPKWLRCSLST